MKSKENALQTYISFGRLNVQAGIKLKVFSEPAYKHSNMPSSCPSAVRVIHNPSPPHVHTHKCTHTVSCPSLAVYRSIYLHSQ